MKSKTSKSKTGKPRKVKAKTTKKKFPGYPLYAASQDITRKGKKVSADLEDPSHPTAEPTDSRPLVSKRSKNSAPGKFDVTKADLKALGPKDGNLDPEDGNEDDELKHRTTPVDFAGKDLDIPNDEAPGESTLDDEENSGYSLGGDDHNDLEEDPS